MRRIFIAGALFVALRMRAGESGLPGVRYLGRVGGCAVQRRFSGYAKDRGDGDGLGKDCLRAMTRRAWMAMIAAMVPARSPDLHRKVSLEMWTGLGGERLRSRFEWLSMEEFLKRHGGIGGARPEDQRGGMSLDAFVAKHGHQDILPVKRGSGFRRAGRLG